MPNSIIPVIDIKNSYVVRARAGDRANYAPIESPLCNTADILDVARAFKKIGFSTLYIADLDAIIKREFSNLNLISDVADMGFDIMLDAGIKNLGDIQNLQDNFKGTGNVSFIIASETAKRELWENLPAILNEHEICASIDTKDGILVSPCFDTLDNFLDVFLDSLEKINDFKNYTGTIILDIKSVGMQRVNFELCEYISEKFCENYSRSDLKKFNMIYGGGVSTTGDMKILKDMGFEKFLVGSALHDPCSEIYRYVTGDE